MPNHPPEDMDLWLLAGQSNMAGSGFGLPYEPPSNQVWLYNLRGQWQIAEEPFWGDRYESTEPGFAVMRSELARAEANPDHCRRLAPGFARRLRQGYGGAGLGLTFGKALAATTGRPVGLIFCAKGDTRLSEWDPDWAGSPYMALYAGALARLRQVGRPLTGVLWYQGESDSFDGQSRSFADRMRRLVAALRRDLGQPELPWFSVQIGNCFMQTAEELPEWTTVQTLQLQLEPELAPGGLTTAVDLPLGDGIHLSTLGQRRLGRRLARLAARGAYGDATIESGPRPVSVTRDPQDSSQLRVAYLGVTGSLQPTDRVAGFAVLAPGSERNLVCAASPDPADGRTMLVRGYCAIPSGSVLWYGRRMTDFCNLADEADMGAPVFGPWAVPD
ncbi:MAG TPA: sialate O-acetylesterase [Armatimonadota bacterium]|jgi:sialate O-acetylesterase